MRKTFLSASLMFLLISTFAIAVNGDMGGTDPNGSPEKPYLIEDLADFDEFASNSAYWAAGVHTKLMTNIDLSGRTYTTAVIAPDATNSFEGVFDGNDHIIANLTSSTGTSYSRYIGLFGYVESLGEIQNLNLNSVNLNTTPSSDFVGALIGYNYGGLISNCTATGVINGSGNLGGLVGYSDGGHLLNCHSNVIVTGNRYGVGGLAGIIGGTDVSFCSATGNVTGDEDFIGGLIGSASGSNINNCFASGNVTHTGDRYSIGGLIGDTSNCIVENCYAIGDVTGNQYIGGLLGYQSGSVFNSYSIGIVNGNSEVGAFSGYSSGTITSCYFLDTAGPNNGYGTPLDDPNMMVETNFFGWDFSDGDGDPADWMMLREGEDTPRLAWQEVFAGDIAGLYGADMLDFAYLASYWGLTGCESGTDCGRADIDQSGDVGLGDLAAVASDWLK